MRHLPAALIAAALLAAAPHAFAETLLIDRVKLESGTAMPARGMRMADVGRTASCASCAFLDLDL